MRVHAHTHTHTHTYTPTDGLTGCTEVGTLTYSHTPTDRLAKERLRNGPLTSRPCLHRMTQIYLKKKSRL